MNVLFLKIVNSGIATSWLILAVMILRILLKKAPKWIHVSLWGLVAFRLICPFSFESKISLVPSAEPIPLHIELEEEAVIAGGIENIHSVVNPVSSHKFDPQPTTVMNPLQIWIRLASILWIVGVVGMFIYTVLTYLRVHHRVDTAILYRENIYQSERVDSPFVLGIIKPRIYLPFQLEDKELDHVLAHEQAHIKRKDHWWKPLGFFLLSIHWFNPLMWLSYGLLCQDIELACDEKVIGKLDNKDRADYSQVLVNCSVKRRMITVCPLTFGEVSVKKRVESVMNYHKPTFWIIIVSVLFCMVVGVCFLTNPSENDTPIGEGRNETASIDEFQKVLIESIGKPVECFEDYEREEASGYYIIGFQSGNSNKREEMKDLGFAVFQVTNNDFHLLDYKVYENAALVENGIYICEDPAVADISGKLYVKSTFDVILICNKEVAKVEQVYHAKGKQDLILSDTQIEAPCISVWPWEYAEKYTSVSRYFYDKHGRQINADCVIPQVEDLGEGDMEAYTTLLSGDQTLINNDTVQWWIPDFQNAGILEYEYTYMDLDGDSRNELLVQLVNNPSGYNGVFHYADGELYCWNSDGMEGSCRDYPLVDETMVRQYDTNGNSNYTIFRYLSNGEKENIHSLLARVELISKNSTEPCPYYEIDGEEVTKEAFEEQLKTMVTDKILGREVWIRN